MAAPTTAMTTDQLIGTHSKGAETYHGAICREKTMKLLEEFSFPNGLMPVDQIVELGFNRSTGFIWLKLKKKTERKFMKIRQTVIYDTEITAFMEPGHLSKLTGIKAKEMLVGVVIQDVLVGFPSPDMMKFTTPIGLSRAHPQSAFLLDEDEQNGAVSASA